MTMHQWLAPWSETWRPAASQRAQIPQLPWLWLHARSASMPPPKRLWACKLLIANKDKETLEYLLFAKKCEALVTQRFGWEYEDKKEKEGANISEQKQVEILLEDGSEFSKNSKNSFLIQRYVFQVVRLAYRTNEGKKAIQYFDKFADHKNKTYMYYRAKPS